MGLQLSAGGEVRHVSEVPERLGQVPEKLGQMSGPVVPFLVGNGRPGKEKDVG